MEAAQSTRKPETAGDPQVVHEVRTRFARIMEIDPDELDMDARLDDVYGVTSMKSMRLVSELEIELGVDIPEEEIERMATLNDVVRLCGSYAPENRPPTAGGG